MNSNLHTFTKSDGKQYTNRNERKRYFFPDEWNKFLSVISNKHLSTHKHRFFFVTCLHSGGRTMEVLNLKHQNIDTERGTITFNTTKQRKAKRNYSAAGKSRSFFVSDNYISEYKSFIRGQNIKPEEYIFLNNSKLPEDYDSLDNKEKKKHYNAAQTSYAAILKRKLKKAGIDDYFNFSLHNIRKTYGMWMRTYNIEIGELCYRLGHDMATYMTHYGSSLIFTEYEQQQIHRIIGEVR